MWSPNKALGMTGVRAAYAIAPADAAFFSATLRGREQYDLIVKSNAYAALMKLPGMKRALAMFEEQRTTPGSPLAMLDTFMQLPENEQAVDLVRDMVSRDTFVYGEPSWIPLARLLKKLQQAQQAGSLLSPQGAGFDTDFLQTEDAAGVPARRARILPVALADATEQLSPEQLQKRLIAQTLIDNVDLVVVPDLVWGFKTTKPEAGGSQLKRIEVLAKLVLQANPDLADSLARKQVAGGDFVTFTVDGGQIPWGEVEREVAESVGDVAGLDKVFDRLRSLKIVFAVGMIGDRVLVSIGDSVDHLEKLAMPAEKPAGDAGGRGLLSQKAFAPLREHADKRITGISYVSGPLATALAPAADDFEVLLEAIPEAMESADMPEGAAKAARSWLGEAAAAYGKRLAVPGPWMAYAFLAEEGYEGYVWDWSKNRPFDGGKRLDLLEHAGGAPVAVAVSRLRSDPDLFDAIVSFISGGLSFVRDYGVPGCDEEFRESFGEFDDHVVPLGEKLVATLRTKILPALADGQVGFVLDAKTKTKRPQRDCPSSSEPLPLLEAAIVLPLEDPKLFREGLSDLFALSDELTDAMREMDPDSVPASYQVPDPEKAKTEGGAVWSFPLPASGLDDQIRPAIGIGEKAAVFSLVPVQAARMLVANDLETGSGLSKFDEPLAAAAALDFPGLVDAVKPWVSYLVRYGCARERDGVVESDEELSAEDENERAREALQHAAVVMEVMKCFRAAVAETSTGDEALVTRWRNVIRDLPAE